MGGVPITFAAAKAPEKFTGLIYVAAFAVVPGKPAGAYLELKEQHEDSKLGAILAPDPMVVGALRVHPRSTDPVVLSGAKEALAADVDDNLWATAMHLSTPDGPFAIYGEVAEFADGYGDLQKTFIRCTQDQTLVSSTCDVIVADMNQAWPSSPTPLVELEASHQAMFSKPKELTDLLIAAT